MCRVNEKAGFLLVHDSNAFVSFKIQTSAIFCMSFFVSVVFLLRSWVVFHCSSLSPSVVNRQLKPNRLCYDLQTEQVDWEHRRSQIAWGCLWLCSPKPLIVLDCQLQRKTTNFGFINGHLGNSRVEAPLHLSPCTGTRSTVESWVIPWWPYWILQQVLSNLLRTSQKAAPSARLQPTRTWRVCTAAASWLSHSGNYDDVSRIPKQGSEGPSIATVET